MRTTTAENPGVARNPSAGRRAFRTASVRTGVYEFIPLPFVDDWLISRERRKIARTILSGRGLEFDEKAIRILAGGGSSFSSKLRSFAKGLLIKPLRKVFRTVFFWLTARSAARNVVATYFLARFLHHPEIFAITGPERISIDHARRLTEVFREVSENIDLKALGGAVRKVGSVLGRRPATTVDRDGLKRAIEEEAPGFISEFDRLVGAKLHEAAG